MGYSNNVAGQILHGSDGIRSCWYDTSYLTRSSFVNLKDNARICNRPDPEDQRSKPPPR